ncbi:MAG TPA: choice-of-anchor Q domain-containing protein [Planctomycetaceae bacterium]|nr:choice-of-anchor Q domain-containing protein [Planctomycetaceae bacterium]
MFSAARFSWRLTLVSAVLAVVPAHASNQVVTNCSNETELRADLTAMQASGGGTLTFNCGVATLALTSVLPSIATATTVDGDNKVTVSGSNNSRIFVVNGGGMLTLENIVLTNGSSTGDGGAIYNGGSLVLKHATIRNSAAQFSGGAFVSYGPVSIDDSELAFNKATNGGAVYPRFPSSVVTITRSVLHDNEATGIAGEGNGGAVFLWDGATVAISDSEIRDNTANRGGGIHTNFSNSSVSVENTRILRNSANGSTGGGIHLIGTPLTMMDVELAENFADASGGGLYYSNGSNATISRSTFRANTALATGGGISTSLSTMSLVNVTISGNYSGNVGGGIFNGNGNVSLVNATITDNDSNDGHALANSTDPAHSITLRNTLIVGNADTTNCGDSAYKTIVSADGNLSDDTSCTTYFNKLHDLNGAQVDAKLGPLGLHGGATPTHVPQPGSAAVDAGIVAGAPGTDQRELARPQGPAVDAGAVEVAACSGPSSALCGDANQNASLSASDALIALRAAVGDANCALWLCDYNGNGSVSATDALSILRASVGQMTTPLCPPKWDCRGLAS